MKGPFLYPRRYAPSREERPPRFERRVKVPLGWLLERLAAPFARWAPERLHTPEVVIAVRGLPAAFAGFRIAFVTDLHRGPCVPDAWLVHVAARTRELGPDVVALGGDFVSHARSELDGIERVLSQFTAPAGVVAVLGNHDCWVGAELVQRELERAGVRVLRNRSHVLERGGAALAIAGVDDFTHGAVRPDEALAAVPPGVPRVLLSHNPDLVEYLPDELRVDVMLAGHTHNGQVHLPVVGPFTVPSQFGSRYLHGLQRVRDTVLYVSAGVGACWVPFRWGNPPELTLVRLEAGG